VEGRLSAIACSVKPRALILDHVGNVLRHGLVDEEREWSLDGKKKRKADKSEPEIKIKQCPKCYAVHAPAPICPECGHVYELGGRQTPDVVDGKLTEVTQEMIDKRRAAMQHRQEIGRAKTREALEALAARKGYRPGWVEHVLRERNRHGAGRPRIQFGG
jgi:ribosomal protein L32